MSRFIVLLSLITLALGTSLHAQNVQKIKDAVLAKQLERGNGIKSYVVAQTMMGRPAVLFFEEVKDEDKNFLGFRQVPLTECMQRVEALQGGMTSEQKKKFFDEYSKGLILMDEAHEREAGISPYGFLHPKMGMNAQLSFLEAAGKSGEQAEKDKKESEVAFDQSNQDMEEFWNSAKLVGTETIDGRKAYHLQSKGAGQVRSGKDAEFTPKVANLWIDTKEYVTLKFNVEGTMKADGKTRPMSIEMESSNFKKVSSLYEPFKQVMRMGGMLDAKQKKEMENAKKQMAEFEKQMKDMPKAQRDMMMRMMGPQIETMKKMVSGDGIEIETIIHQIKIGDIRVYEEMMQWAAQTLATGPNLR